MQPIKVYIPNNSKQSLGGGWTFLRSIKEGGQGKLEFVTSWFDCDIILITSATMTNRDEMKEAQAAGKKIVFRVDNIPKDSRNRGTAFSRMMDYAKMSDYIVFQSEWAKEYAGWWFEQNGVALGSKSQIIYNGINPAYFFPKEGSRASGRYLFVHYNRDENKRFPEVAYTFHQEFRKNPKVELWLVGAFSPELVEYDFDFFAGEQVRYMGVIEDPKQLGEIYRACEYIMFPAFADASPNTLLEAISCGCKPVGINDVGGSKEVVNLAGRTINQMADEYLEVFNKVINK